MLKLVGEGAVKKSMKKMLRLAQRLALHRPEPLGSVYKGNELLLQLQRETGIRKGRNVSKLMLARAVSGA